MRFGRMPRPPGDRRASLPVGARFLRGFRAGVRSCRREFPARHWRRIGANRLRASPSARRSSKTELRSVKYPICRRATVAESRTCGGAPKRSRLLPAPNGSPLPVRCRPKGRVVASASGRTTKRGVEIAPADDPFALVGPVLSFGADPRRRFSCLPRLPAVWGFQVSFLRIFVDSSARGRATLS